MARVTVRREHDIDWMREVHRIAFPNDAWRCDADTFWVAARGSELLAFASARIEGDMLELTRCAVVSSAGGTGMQRRMLRVREAYARREGCTSICTYTTRDNYPSITNLIRAGYKFSPHQRGEQWFNFVKYLR